MNALRSIPASLALLSLGACSSSETVCPAIGCVDEFVVVLTPTESVFLPGDYTLSATLDGTELETGFDIPVSGEGSGGDGEAILVASARAGIRIEFRGTPELVLVRIDREGIVLLDEVFEPDYAEVRPAPDCPLICVQDSAELAVDPV